MAGERCRLGGDSLLQVAVGDDREDAVVDHRVSRSVELCGEAPLGDRRADAVRKPLAERTGGRLHAGRESELRMAWRARSPLSE